MLLLNPPDLFVVVTPQCYVISLSPDTSDILWHRVPTHQLCIHKVCELEIQVRYPSCPNEQFIVRFVVCFEMRSYPVLYIFESRRDAVFVLSFFTATTTSRTFFLTNLAR